MREIKSNESVFHEHAEKMGKLKNEAYLPLQDGNMTEAIHREKRVLHQLKEDQQNIQKRWRT